MSTLKSRPRAAAAALAAAAAVAGSLQFMPLAASAAEADVVLTPNPAVTGPEFEATNGQLVKQPVEWLLGAARQLGVEVNAQLLRPLGQVPFRPPSVGGWPVGAAWLTTSSTQARIKTGLTLAARADAAVQTLTEAGKADRLDALARLLVVDRWTDRTAAVLTPAVQQPQRLLALGLATPEYAVH